MIDEILAYNRRFVAEKGYEIIQKTIIISIYELEHESYCSSRDDNRNEIQCPENAFRLLCRCDHQCKAERDKSLEDQIADDDYECILHSLSNDWIIVKPDIVIDADKTVLRRKVLPLHKAVEQGSEQRINQKR